jgi:hypothetical protein
MKQPPNTPEFANFTQAVRKILTVSKAEIEARIEAQKKSGKRLSKGASRVPVASSTSET